MCIILVTDQFIHCYVSDVTGTFSSYVTAMYAKNSVQEKMELWNDLRVLEILFRNHGFLVEILIFCYHLMTE